MAPPPSRRLIDALAISVPSPLERRHCFDDFAASQASPLERLHRRRRRRRLRQLSAFAASMTSPPSPPRVVARVCRARSLDDKPRPLAELLERLADAHAHVLREELLEIPTRTPHDARKLAALSSQTHTVLVPIPPARTPQTRTSGIQCIFTHCTFFYWYLCTRRGTLIIGAVLTQHSRHAGCAKQKEACDSKKGQSSGHVFFEAQTAYEIARACQKSQHGNCPESARKNSQDWQFFAVKHEVLPRRKYASHMKKKRAKAKLSRQAMNFSSNKLRVRARKLSMLETTTLGS